MGYFELLLCGSAGAAAGVAMMFCANVWQFRRSPNPTVRAAAGAGGEYGLQQPRVAVLIPARNEAERLGATLEALLRSEGVDLKVLVLDDESSDGTGNLVETWRARDGRVQLLRGAPKPAGWSGKQWACQQLGEAAGLAAEELIFLDADVRVSADALARTVGFRRALGVDLLSGFPRQQVESPGERLLIPQMHVILLCFLPFVLMRRSQMAAASAGCGQYMSTTGSSWRSAGGHAAIRESLHDGIRLPRSYRLRGLRTDIFDASDIAVCRMYGSFGETWQGLLKNATEGFARQPLLMLITGLIASSAILPVFLVPAAIYRGTSSGTALAVAVCTILSYLPRTVCCLRFDGSWGVVVLQPVAMMLFLAVQWTAWIRWKLGLGVQWRSRAYETAVE